MISSSCFDSIGVWRLCVESLPQARQVAREHGYEAAAIPNSFIVYFPVGTDHGAAPKR